MQELFAVLPALLREHGDIAEVRDSVVFAAWRRVAGERLAERTEPIAFDGSRLVIAVADNTWCRHLETLSAEMIFRINAVLGQAQVRFIEFRVDPSAAGSAAGERTGVQSLAEEADKEVTGDLRRAADAISDEDARRRFLAAASSCLARQRRMRQQV